MSLEVGGQVPHFVVRRLDGTTFSYGDIWQRRNLLLVSLGAQADARAQEMIEAAFIASLLAHDDTLREYESEVVITRDVVDGLPPPSVLVADRWGEIVAIEHASDITLLPEVANILERLRFVAHACPECEAEAR